MDLTPEQYIAYKQLESFIKITQKHDNTLLLAAEAGAGKTFITAFLVMNNSSNCQFFIIAHTHFAVGNMVNHIKKFTNNEFQSATTCSFFNRKHSYDMEGNDTFTTQRNTNGNMITRFEDLFRLSNNNIIIVDEAGLIGIEDYNLLKELSLRYNIKIIFLGDKNQLTPIINATEKKNAKLAIDTLAEIAPILNTDVLSIIHGCLFYNNIFSATFTIPLQVQLAGNYRFGNPGVSTIATICKDNIAQKKFLSLFPHIRAGIVNFTSQTFLDPAIRDGLINNEYQILSHSNGRVCDVNGTVRDLKYSLHPHYDYYKYLENERLVCSENIRINKNMIFINSETFEIQNIEYGIRVQSTPFLVLTGISKTFNIQKIRSKNIWFNQATIDDSINVELIFGSLKKLFVALNKGNEKHVKPRKEYMCDICDEIAKDPKYCDLNICDSCIQSIKKATKRMPFQDRMKNLFLFKRSLIIPVIFSNCITVYKSQGQTYDNIIVDLKHFPRWLDIRQVVRLIYTAVSRAKNSVIFTTQ